MVSSRTDARAAAGPCLRALLDTQELREVAGNTPILLDEPDVCWWLEDGRIELFMVETGEGGPQGVRRHFASVGPGTLLFGARNDDDWPRRLALLAVPHVNTHVRRMPLPSIRSVGETAPHELAQPVDQWISTLSSGLAKWVAASPFIHHAAEAGATIRVQANQRVGAAQRVVWLEFPRNTALFLDIQDMPPGIGSCPVPLSPDSWVQSGEPLELTACDTPQMLENGRLWSGLDTLHQLLLPTAQTNLMLVDVDEHNRIRQRAESARRDWHSGLGAMHEVLAGRRAGAPRANTSLPPLAQALQIVGHAEGFDIRLPARNAPGSGTMLANLSALLHASGLRSRKVVLEPGWERFDTQAMLGFARDDGRPLAILPDAARGVRVVDPVKQTTLHGANALAVLDDHAWVITAALPFTALDWKALPIFTFRRGWRELLVLLLTGICGGVLGMAVPIASSYLIDTVIPGHDTDLLTQLGVILVVLGMASFIMSYVGGLAFSRFQARTTPALQAAIVDRLLRLPVGFFRRFSAGDLALRANAVTQVDQLLSGSVAQALLGSIFAVFSFGQLLYYDWRLGLVAVALIAAYTALFLTFIWLQLRQERQVAHVDGLLQSLMLQLVTGIAKIRLSASEDRAFSRWANLFARCQNLHARSARYANLQALLNTLFGLLPIAVFFFVLGYFREPDKLNMFAIGGLAAFLAAFNRFHQSVTQMTQTVVGLLAARPMLERAMPILTATPEISEDREDPGVLSGAVEFSLVSFRYSPEGPLILDEVSLSARAGEFVAIVGPSGCGKSTLLRLLLGFETPEKGQVLLDGKDMSELDILAVRRQMGVVLQNSRPLAGSLYENIVGTTDRGLADAWEAARMAGLAEDIQRMPMGMHTMITESGSLSGGQIQRLMIARAIVGRPRILVLDEATSALDNRVQAMITESLDRLSVTRIVVAHRLSTVVKANRIYVMDAGRVVEQGTFEELMQKNGAFARLAAAQLV